MRAQLIRQANDVVNHLIENTTDDNVDLRIFTAMKADVDSRKIAEEFFKEEKKIVNFYDTEDDRKRIYELAYISLMYNYFHNQFIYSFLSKAKSEKSKSLLRDLSKAGYFTDLDKKAKALEEVKNKHFEKYEYDDFEFYRMNIETNEIDEYLQPMRKIKIGFY